MHAIVAKVALVIAIIIAIVVWSVVIIEYRKILRQRKIDRLIDGLIERAKNSGYESEGEVSPLVEMGVEVGDHAPCDIGDL
uniref:Protein Vpu n=1 Tax=Human immunodeficiency virus type 1 TaxID=11676 RepID=I6QLX7_HV1|nr:vpu protein [Human immunodeficiency virus 1]